MFVSIGETAVLLGVAIITLRRWDKAGVLCPSWRSPGLHRRYEMRKHVEDRDVHAAVNIQHEAISNFKNYSAATEEITPGEILALPETSNKGSGNRDRGTRKGTKVARQERPNIKYNERQKSFQIKALIRQ